MCNSYINAARQFDFQLNIACPQGYLPMQALLQGNANAVVVTHTPLDAIADADLVVTDVWASMGQEAEQRKRAAIFADFQITPELMKSANPDALFMHCLPAHRGEEISEDMLEHPGSVVWDEAENRLHAQKALLEFLLNQHISNG